MDCLHNNCPVIFGKNLFKFNDQFSLYVSKDNIKYRNDTLLVLNFYLKVNKFNFYRRMSFIRVQLGKAIYVISIEYKLRKSK